LIQAPGQGISPLDPWIGAGSGNSFSSLSSRLTHTHTHTLHTIYNGSIRGDSQLSVTCRREQIIRIAELTNKDWMGYHRTIRTVEEEWRPVGTTVKAHVLLQRNRKWKTDRRLLYN